MIADLLFALIGAVVGLLPLGTARADLWQHRRYPVLAAVCFVVAALCVVDVARAQDDDHHHHPFHKDFYSKWQRPNGMGSCCNARIEEDGVERGDCEPSESRIGNGEDGRPHWFARLPHRGDFIEVPDRLVIHERNPEQGGPDGHLCWTPATGVLCFVPPSTGM